MMAGGWAGGDTENYGPRHLAIHWLYLRFLDSLRLSGLSEFL